MKKEAREQARKMYLDSAGKKSNREIAEAVKVNPLTIGRWKAAENWAGMVKKSKAPAKRVRAPRGVRKKEARDKALQLFQASGGAITNKKLAAQVKVSAATIAKWKAQDKWTAKVPKAPKARKAAKVVKGVKRGKAAKPGKPGRAPARARLKLDLGELASPEHMTQINRKLEALLQREHLTAAEVADLADAKSGLLAALETYLAIVREMGEIRGK
jgi:uncharacterized protein YjcR